MLDLEYMFMFSPGEGGGGSGSDSPDGEGGNTEVNETAKQSKNDFMVPKHRFDEVSRKAKEYEAKVAELTAKLEEVTAKDAKIAELEAKIKELTEAHEAEKVTAKKIGIIKEKIGDRVVDFDLVVSLLDLDEIQVNEEGKIKGLSAQVAKLQKSKPYLWKKAEAVVKPGAGTPSKSEKTFAQKLAEKKVASNATVAKSRNYFSR